MKTKTIKGKKYKLVPVKNEKSVEEQRIASEQFFKDKLGLEIVERGLKVNLPTKAGQKEFEGVKFSNGNTGVYVYGGTTLKYAWE